MNTDQSDAAAAGARRQCNNMARVCWHCGSDQELMRVCRICDVARYCSPECARADRKVGHGPICATLATLSGAWKQLMATHAEHARDPNARFVLAELVTAALRQRTYAAAAAPSDSSSTKEEDE